MWSGPRNISTALMYSFRSRPDTEVVDEPLYGHYLATTGIAHPGDDEVLAVMETDADRAVEMMLAEGDKPLRFSKNMAHHMVGLDFAILDRMTNVMLTRHPQAVIASLTRQLPDADAEATGLPMQVAMVDHIQASGRRVMVIDSDDILADPRGTLVRLCEEVGIEFYPEMLTWPPGPKPEDGVWAPYWYDNVHRSTGFGPRPGEMARVQPGHEALLAECLPLYERLRSIG